MKLTKYAKETFIRAVMADVPKEDYKEKAAKIMEEDAQQQRPALIATAYAAHPAYFNRKNIYVEDLGYVTVCGVASEFQPSEPALQKLREISKLEAAQDNLRCEIRSRSEAVVGSCSTDKQLRQRLPELEKYLPSEATDTQNLPQCGNLIAELTAAGWKAK